jgi:hypothetical protein
MSLYYDARSEKHKKRPIFVPEGHGFETFCV